MCFREFSGAPATARASPPAGAAASKKQPVAICRLKRVAADYKDDVSGRMPKKARIRNGKRVALVGGGPASLTVARDLAPLGYECVVLTAIRRPAA